MKQEELQKLLEKYLADELSEAEFSRLWTALQEPGNRKVWQEFMQDVWNDPQYMNLADEQTKRKVLEELQPMLRPVVRTKKRYLWWAGAAAACLVLIASTLLWRNEKAPLKAPVAQQKPVEVPVQPGGNKAMLTLGDGSTIVLDSASNGTLSQQGNTKVLKTANGQLVYQNEGRSDEILFNTVRTPRGGMYRILLPDGTAVWLNAASSITYPTVFTGGERKVEVTGEAYFEVAKKDIPFRVYVTSINKQEKGKIEVLGTSFNVNAYDDEPSIRTTLLKGAVKISKQGISPVVLHPGQQADMKDAITVNTKADISQAIAWKNGYFKFTQADVQTVMRQAERWYDITAKFPNGWPKDLFSGTLPRSVSLHQFLKIMEYSDVNTKIEGRIVTINP